LCGERGVEVNKSAGNRRRDLIGEVNGSDVGAGGIMVEEDT
jgi:hypothetical protein